MKKKTKIIPGRGLFLATLIVEEKLVDGIYVQDLHHNEQTRKVKVELVNPKDELDFKAGDIVVVPVCSGQWMKIRSVDYALYAITDPVALMVP